MSALEWIVMIEAVLLAALILFSVAGWVIARNDPDDPIVTFCRSFWHEFLHPPIESARASRGATGKPAPRREAGESPAPSRQLGKNKKDEAAMYGRVEPGADGVVHTANLNVVVLPHSEKDEVLGRTKDGIEVMVTGAPEDGASNKAVIQLVSKALGVKPYQVTLTKGHYQTRKAVAVTGLEQDQLDAKLEAIE
ncbi:MAG: DUF167 domain-containing protein [Planctomycetota bacterium]|nr:DUF167 domain-containing protein [Planctomycetota bacterium]